MPEPVNFNRGIIFDREIKLEESAILHYTYPKFSDLTSRRDRCGCKPTKVDVKRCFMLEFDRAVSGGLIPFFLVYCCEAYKSQSSFLCRHLSLLQPQAQRKCFNGISIFIVHFSSFIFPMVHSNKLHYIQVQRARCVDRRHIEVETP